MSEWRTKLYVLTDLGEVSRGRSRHRPRDDKSLFGGKYPFIQTGDVKSANFYLTKYTQTYNEKGLAQSKLWKSGTLCITIAANIAETAILAINACFPDSVVGFIPFEKISDVRYVKYYFDIFKKQMQSMSLGATQDNFSVDKMLRVKFSFPDFHVQKRIGDILSAYDDAIENNNRRIALLEKTAQELYKEWFVRFRFPGHENTKFINGLPEGWEIRKIKTLVKRLSFKNLYKESDVFPIGKVVVIDQSLKECLGYHNSEADYLASSDHPIILFGDHSCKMQFMITPFSLAENTIPLRANEGVTEAFLFATLLGKIETTEYKRHWTELVNKKTIVPNIELQKRYDAMVIPLFIQSQIMKRQSQNLARQRDLLLPRLMSGKTEV